MTKQWELHKNQILQYYHSERKKLEDVIELMHEQHGFNASKRAYRKRFAQWGTFKYLKNRIKASARSLSEPGSPTAHPSDYFNRRGMGPSSLLASQPHSVPGALTEHGQTLTQGGLSRPYPRGSPQAISRARALSQGHTSHLPRNMSSHDAAHRNYIMNTSIPAPRHPLGDSLVQSTAGHLIHHVTSTPRTPRSHPAEGYTIRRDKRIQLHGIHHTQQATLPSTSGSNSQLSEPNRANPPYINEAATGVHPTQAVLPTRPILQRTVARSTDTFNNRALGSDTYSHAQSAPVSPDISQHQHYSISGSERLFSPPMGHNPGNSVIYASTPFPDSVYSSPYLNLSSPTNSLQTTSTFGSPMQRQLSPPDLEAGDNTQSLSSPGC